MRLLLFFSIILCACNDQLTQQQAAERLVTSYMDRKVKTYEPVKTVLDTNKMKLSVDDKKFDRLHSMIRIESMRLQKGDSTIEKKRYDSLLHLEDSLKALDGKIVIDTSIAFWNITHTYKSTDVRGNPVMKKVKLLANKSLNKIIEEGDDFYFYPPAP